MMADRDEFASGTQSPNDIDGFRAEINAENFPDALRITSEAVTLLADRLNAVGLRIALIGNIRSEPAASANIESYLHRLSSLVDAAAAQMRFIQKLLDMIQSETNVVEHHDGHVMATSPATSEKSKG